MTNQDKINKLPKKKTYEEKIENKGVNVYMFTDKTNQSKKEQYEKLLSGKVKDEQIMQDIIIYREAILRKRISMKITVTETEVGQKGIFVLVGGLPEDEDYIKDFFMGRIITSNEWQETINELKTNMQNQGKMVLEVISLLAPMKKTEVRRIEAIVTFA